MNKNEDKIINHIKAKIPLLIIGESGWGKSSIIEQVCKKLKLPVILANANSWTAEDFGGIPQPFEKYYKYLPPKWVIDNKKKEFVLFIDEINQASVPVLHALYRVVLNKEVAGIHLSNMHIIAAGNREEENPYLTELPEPLLKRFSVYEWEKNNSMAVKYLNNKYNVNITEIITNPRQTEMAINLLSVDDKESAIKLAGIQVINQLNNCTFQSKGKQLINEIELNEVKKRNGIL